MLKVPRTGSLDDYEINGSGGTACFIFGKEYLMSSQSKWVVVEQNTRNAENSNVTHPSGCSRYSVDVLFFIPEHSTLNNWMLNHDILISPLGNLEGLEFTPGDTASEKRCSGTRLSDCSPACTPGPPTAGDTFSVTARSTFHPLTDASSLCVNLSD